MRHSSSFLAQKFWFLGIASTLRVSLTILGCAGSGPRIKHEHSISPGQGYHPGLTKALLVPLNQVHESVSGLDVADAAIERLVTEYLETQGLVVETVSLREYRRVFALASQAARQEMLSGESGNVSDSIEFSDVLTLLIAEIGSDAELVVLPNVMQRAGAYSGGSTVRWDGVRRRERGTRGSMSGTTSAASLYTMIYRSDGKQLFSAFGGLDLLFELNMSKKKYELREDRLQDEENLAEGVCISFHPFFGDDARC